MILQRWQRGIIYFGEGKQDIFQQIKFLCVLKENKITLFGGCFKDLVCYNGSWRR